MMSFEEGWRRVKRSIGNETAQQWRGIGVKKLNSSTAYEEPGEEGDRASLGERSHCCSYVGAEAKPVHRQHGMHSQVDGERGEWCGGVNKCWSADVGVNSLRRHGSSDIHWRLLAGCIEETINVTSPATA
jgi:hypothetical protein